MEEIVPNTLSPEDTYELLDVMLTDLLQRTSLDLGDDEILSLIVSYNRQLRIALGLPVEVAF